jgi:HlyD family secretion protein
MRITTPYPHSGNQSGVKLPSLLRQGWLLLPMILVIIAGIVFWWLPSRLAPAPAATTVTVSQGNLTINVSGSGTVAAARQVDLPFQQAGTVTDVTVQVGDSVKAGQVLARIDDRTLQLQLQQAQANLASAQAALAKAQGGSPTPQELASAQAALDNARAQLTKTRTANVTNVQQAQAALASAQAKLDALKNPTPSDISAAQLKLQQAQTTLQTTMDSDSQAKTNAYNQTQQAVDSLTQAQSTYATAQQNWAYVESTGRDPAQPSTTNAQGQKVANKLNDTQRQQYYNTFVQAQAALQSAQTAVQQAQVNYDAARQKEAAEVPQAQAAVQDAQRSLDALVHPSATDLQQAQAAVTQAQAQLNALRGGGTAADLAAAQSTIVQNQSALEALTAPAAAPDIAAAKATAAQAQANLASAQQNLDEATLKAPFDGVVAAVNVQPGSIVGGGSGGSSSSTSSTGSAAITLVDRSTLHGDVNLSETDAARVAVGQPVTLTFDALPNVTLSGKVATIGPAATVQQNVVTYPVQVEFDPGTTPIKVGMSTTADIQVQQINNAILVPSRAVQTSGTTKIVTVLQGAQQIPVAVQVDTGPTSNGETQITGCVATGGSQCLRPGDVLAVPTSTTTTTANSGQNRGVGGFGGGGFGGLGGGR